MHQNEAITDIEKMNYMKTSLKGNAASAGDGVTLLSANYNLLRCWKRDLGKGNP